MTALPAGIGLVADALLGEPPVAVHPVARFGSLMARVERRIYAPTRARGVAHTLIGTSIACGVGIGLQRILGRRTACALATCVCAAGRMLDGEATAIARLLEAGDLSSARQRLPSLVGRDPTDLDAGEISRAVIESIAENGVDAVTATLWWATVAGAPGALVHRAINTLDAMVGHRTERYEHFGWASARLDDAANYIPARLSAIAVAATTGRVRRVWRTVSDDARRHPSPNGGVIEAAFAAALGIQLGGANTYDGEVEDRGTLGAGRSPQVGDIRSAIRLRQRSTAVLGATLIAIQIAGHVAESRRKR